MQVVKVRQLPLLVLEIEFRQRGEYAWSSGGGGGSGPGLRRRGRLVRLATSREKSRSDSDGNDERDSHFLLTCICAWTQPRNASPSSTIRAPRVLSVCGRPQSSSPRTSYLP